MTYPSETLGSCPRCGMHAGCDDVEAAHRMAGCNNCLVDARMAGWWTGVFADVSPERRRRIVGFALELRNRRTGGGDVPGA